MHVIIRRLKCPLARTVRVLLPQKYAIVQDGRMHLRPVRKKVCQSCICGQ